MKNNGSMNRMYRVVWNAATGAWQAVAEIAKGHGKSQSTGSTARAAQAAAAPAFKWSTLSLAVAAALTVVPVHAAELGAQTVTDANAGISVGSGDTVTVSAAGGQTAVNVSFTSNNAFTTSIQNAGTISATSTDNNAKAVSVGTGNYPNVGTGNITITNSGSITASPAVAYSGEGIFISTQNSVVDITNQATGTITVNGGSGSSAGIRLTNSNLLSGSTITNEGDITVTGVNGILSGIRHDGGVLNNSTISNSGNINVTDGEEGFGIRTGGLLGSSITNTASGSITVTSSASASNGYGIRVGNNLQSQAGDRAQITNAGLIDVSVVRHAWGIYLDGTAINEADITNAAGATIQVTSTSNNRRAQGIYLYAENINDLNLTNSGTITATGRDAFGIKVYNENYVYLNNSTITNASGATITASSPDGNAVGIAVWSDSAAYIYNTTINNAGTITVDGYNGARGVSVNRLQASHIINSGTINVTSANGSVTGIEANSLEESTVSGTLTQSSITNSGTINLLGTGGTGADNSYGIKVNTASNASTIVNDGTIRSLNANVPNGDVHGIFVSYLNDSASVNNSGTITLADGNTTYGIKVDNLNSNAAAAINNSGTITVNSNGWGQGIYVGSGSGEIRNSGTITSTFDSAAHFWAYSITSPANVNVTNTSTGVLNGNLNVAGTMTNAGTISLPHNANSDQAGTSANVGTFINSGILKIGLLTDGMTTTHSQLVTNTATFNAGSKISVNVLGTSSNVGLLAGGTLNDVVKSTTLTLNTTPTVVDNSALLNFEFVQDGNNIDLNIVDGAESNTILTSTIAGGGNINAQSAAAALQTIKDAGTLTAMDPVFSALNTLQSDEQVAAAVNSFTPVTTTASVSAGRQIANSIQDIVEIRQNVNIGGAAGGLNSGDPLFADRNFWLKPFGTWGEQKDKSGLNGFDLKTRGIGFGVDGEYDKNKKLGFAFFYTNADIDVNNMAQKAGIDVYSALLYGNMPMFDEMTNLLFQAGYSTQKTDTSRFIALTGDEAKGDYTAKVASLDLKLVRDVLMLERLLLQPKVSLTYRHFTNPSYTESGAGALNQNVDSFSSSQTTLGIGARMHYMVDDASKLMANVNYGRDMKSNELSVSTGFVGAPGVRYQTRGIDNGRNSYELGLGYERNVDKTSKLNVMYTHQGQGSSFKNDAISATYTLKF